MAACAAMAGAGCAVTHTTAGPGTASRTAGSTTPRERAVADAAAILKAFAVPPGARRLQRALDALKVPITTVVSATLVDDVSFWRAPGPPQAVLAWEQAHLARRFTPGDEDFGPPSWDRMFSLSPVPGVLNARDLVVEVTGVGPCFQPVPARSQSSGPGPVGLSQSSHRLAAAISPEGPGGQLGGTAARRPALMAAGRLLGGDHRAADRPACRSPADVGVLPPGVFCDRCRSGMGSFV
jgi:hypothetical protein